MKKSYTCNQFFYYLQVKRELYLRTYDTTMVLPDGATIRVRYPEPRQIIRFGSFCLIEFSQKSIRLILKEFLIKV